MSTDSLHEARVIALARLQASRERLRHDMQPGLGGRRLHWLEQPWRLLRRWWRRERPAVAAGQWLQASAGDTAALHKAGEAAIVGGRRWVQQHPVAGLALAATLGALLVYKRATLWGLVLGLGQGVLHQGKNWALQQASDPALYATLVAALMTKAAVSDNPDE